MASSLCRVDISKDSLCCQPNVVLDNSLLHRDDFILFYLYFLLRLMSASVVASRVAEKPDELSQVLGQQTWCNTCSSSVWRSKTSPSAEKKHN